MAGVSKVSGVRKTLRQMAEESSGSNPSACPRCGCEGPHKVINTYEAMGGKRRRMSCRACHYGPIFSMEFVVPKGHRVEIVADESEES
jgi:hypothetical protein